MDNSPVRLICFSRGCKICSNAGKISDMLRVPNGADSESRVFLDLETDPCDERAAALLCELEGCAQKFRFLGAYEERKEGSSV